MYAIILTGGKQYKATTGDVLEVEKLDAKPGEKVQIPALMVVKGNSVVVGQEATQTITAEILSHGKAKKVVVYKYKPKKNQRTKKGHRQLFTRIKIGKIG